MKAHPFVACIAAGMTVLSFFGCKGADPTPSFNPGTVQTKSEIFYPEGPFGVGEGSIIPNLSFIGYANAVADSTAMQQIQLGDFYNPHGRDATYQPKSPAEDDRLYPAGSQYGEGKPKPTVLAIDVASVWCGPCNAEAKCVLPVHEQRYTPCGGGLFLQLQDGPTVGKAATAKNLYNWTVKSYKEAFPSAIDPEGRIISTIATQEAFPTNILVDTTTMKIVKIVPGVPDDTYWNAYESLLADPSCPGKQPQCAADADCPTGTTCSTTCPQNAILCRKGACQAAGCKNQ